MTFEQNRIGAHIGSVYCGVPTVADDVTLIAEDAYDLQSMLDIQIAHANKFRYIISNQKSCVLKYRDKRDISWSMNGEVLSSPESATHLGIKRDTTSKFGVKDVVSDRIQTARKTVFALMGAGLHGLNGINPSAAVHLVNCYVVPRLLYGLDVIRITKTDIQKLSSYYIRLLKQIQHLPERTANAAVLLLAGQIPIEAELHKRMLSLFRNIIDNEGSMECKIASRQLALKNRDSNSWFIKIVELADKYELPSPYDMLQNIPTKYLWKQLVNKRINDFWLEQLVTEARGKSSLNLLNFENIRLGTTHIVWKSCGTEPYEVTRASVKSKLLCGVYTLQSDKAKFKKQGVSALCLMCFKEPEDRKHFVLRCPALADVRTKFMILLKDCLKDHVTDSILNELFSDDNSLLQLIIDCTKYHFILGDVSSNIERLSRSMCFALHQRRSFLLA